ncbi:MAG: UDP-N-acetylglucosamine 2-epimerase (non-hydrolyzing) [Tannerellaceae bacterium]|nr:UDP-N-acetylglucosamine 2-epimerase (non-hydrolyzing) [Tannerellaceae bacterium]MCD8263639.1 UDP-N-acetylglucosamine 2-epimerase (non-hydrolyzing) [Tannerellaceae bacterium]
MKIVTIVGARPQFIKAAMVSRAIDKHNNANSSKIEELIIHTGQHYDENMSRIFFSDLRIPQPSWQLQCGNGSHGEMTGKMLIEIEKILLKAMPDQVLVYGDTNSTLAGTLAASKLHIPVIHIEAGLRSFNKMMPEETNRILTDHIASFLFCPTSKARENLSREGITENVFQVGDVMYDAALLFGEKAEKKSTILSSLGIKSGSFKLCTFHREENTNHIEHVTGIIKALLTIGTVNSPVILPLHPRTHTYLKAYNLLQAVQEHPGIHLIDPVGYPDMVMLEKHASLILTDSGGIQKEAYFHQTPCITLREETEWEETVLAGWNQLAGTDTERIISCYNNSKIGSYIDEYGSGNAADKIISYL